MGSFPMTCVIKLSPPRRVLAFGGLGEKADARCGRRGTTTEPVIIANRRVAPYRSQPLQYRHTNTAPELHTAAHRLTMGKSKKRVSNKPNAEQRPPTDVELAVPALIFSDASRTPGSKVNTFELAHDRITGSDSDGSRNGLALPMRLTSLQISS